MLPFSQQKTEYKSSEKTPDDRSINFNLEKYFNSNFSNKATNLDQDDSKKNLVDISIIPQSLNNSNIDKSSFHGNTTSINTDNQNVDNLYRFKLSFLTTFYTENQKPEEIKKCRKNAKTKEQKTQKLKKKKEPQIFKEFESVSEEKSFHFEEKDLHENWKMSFLTSCKLNPLAHEGKYNYDLSNFIQDRISKTTSESKYPCHFCSRIFSCPAAQGGHQSKHHKGKKVNRNKN